MKKKLFFFHIFIFSYNLIRIKTIDKTLLFFIKRKRNARPQGYNTLH
jgi:hypothetical protein